MNYKAIFQFCSLSLQSAIPTDYGKQVIPYTFDTPFPLDIILPFKIVNLFQEKFLHKFGIPRDVFNQFFSTLFTSEYKVGRDLTLRLDSPTPLYNTIKLFSMYRYLHHHHKKMGFQSLENLIEFYKIIRPKKELFSDIKFLFKDTIPHIIDLLKK